MLLILGLTMFWVHSFFGNPNSSSFIYTGNFMNMLSGVIIVLIIVGFLS